MHEYPATKRIIEIAEEYAQKHGARAVIAIHLVVGEASGYMSDSILLYFDIIAKGTPCAQAELTVKSVKSLLRCKECGQFFERKPFSFACPHCGGEGEPTEIGREFYVESIEIESE